MHIIRWNTCYCLLSSVYPCLHACRRYEMKIGSCFAGGNFIITCKFGLGADSWKSIALLRGIDLKMTLRGGRWGGGVCGLLSWDVCRGITKYRVRLRSSRSLGHLMYFNRWVWICAYPHLHVYYHHGLILGWNTYLCKHGKDDTLSK